MKTIALDERTFELIKDLKRKQKFASFNLLIRELIKKETGVKDSMFGALKGKTKPFTRKERVNLWKDSNRLK